MRLFRRALLLGLLAWSMGQMAMPLADYLGDIGLSYAILPVVATGLGAAGRRTSGT